MKISCPLCGTASRPITRGQTIGSVLGITSGGILALLGTVRETSGYGPVERAAAVILGVLGAASFGGLTGSRVGKLIDEHAIRHYRCPKCRKEFRLS